MKYTLSGCPQLPVHSLLHLPNIINHTSSCDLGTSHRNFPLPRRLKFALSNSPVASVDLLSRSALLSFFQSRQLSIYANKYELIDAQTYQEKKERKKTPPHSNHLRTRALQLRLHTCQYPPLSISQKKCISWVLITRFRCPL